MGRASARGLAAVVAIAAGCGADQITPPAACLAGAERVTSALRTAPDPVRLDDGTRLSTCLRRAQRDADLQQVGRIFTSSADGLAVQARSSDTAALRLGYLIAAARRGARTTNGVAAELVRRLEQSPGLDGPPAAHHPAFDQGMAAGERHG